MNKHDATIYLKGIKDFYGLDKDSEEAVDMAIEALQFQDIMVNNPKTAKPTPEVCKNCTDNKQDDWIPVSERLPEVGSEVLVCFDFKGKRSVSISELYSDGKFHGFDDEYLTPEGRKYRKAVAWMPLPEPYKGGDTE